MLGRDVDKGFQSVTCRECAPPGRQQLLSQKLPLWTLETGLGVPMIQQFPVPVAAASPVERLTTLLPPTSLHS